VKFAVIACFKILITWKDFKNPRKIQSRKPIHGPRNKRSNDISFAPKSTVNKYPQALCSLMTSISCVDGTVNSTHKLSLDSSVSIFK